MCIICKPQDISVTYEIGLDLAAFFMCLCTHLCMWNAEKWLKTWWNKMKNYIVMQATVWGHLNYTIQRKTHVKSQTAFNFTIEPSNGLVFWCASFFLKCFFFMHSEIAKSFVNPLDLLHTRRSVRERIMFRNFIYRYHHSWLNQQLKQCSHVRAEKMVNLFWISGNHRACSSLRI